MNINIYRILFFPQAEKSQAELVRYALVKQRLKDVMQSFESTWTPLQTIHARRSLYLIDAIGRGSLFSAEAHSNELFVNNNDLVAHIKGFQKEPSEYSEVTTMKSVARMAWVWDWHAVMIARNLSYDSLSNRLKALRQLPPDLIDGFPDWIQITGSMNCTSSLQCVCTYVCMYVYMYIRAILLIYLAC